MDTSVYLLVPSLRSNCASASLLHEPFSSALFRGASQHGRWQLLGLRYALRLSAVVRDGPNQNAKSSRTNLRLIYLKASIPVLRHVGVLVLAKYIVVARA